MAYAERLKRHTIWITLATGLASSPGGAQQPEPNEVRTEAQTRQHILANEPSLTSFEKMELHHRRYTTAVNNMAQLSKQLNQKAQEAVLAARAAEAKDTAQNRRQFELKLRQLDNASSTYAVQYSQLQAQMQNEYRNYMALSNELKERYAVAKEVKNETRETSELKPKTGKSKDQKKEPKDQKDLKEQKGKEARATGETRNVKAKESGLAEMGRTAPSVDPRIMDLDTAEVRARRDGLKPPDPAPTDPASGPRLNIIR